MAKKKCKPSRASLLSILFWKVGRLFVPFTVARKYGFTGTRVRVAGRPYLVFSNHLTHLDPFLMGISFAEPLSYVASEHLMRKSYAGVLTLLADPILRLKSRTEANTVMEILRRLRAGRNVCVFIEGDRSYSGQTEFIPDSAAHLVKLSGVTLVTYRMERGYFTQPRWADSIRKGSRMHGHMVAAYSPEAIAAMSREELNAVIRRDLFVDAYEEQEEEMLAYPGERLAEHLETALYRCPSCGQIGTLHSEDDRFSCACGLSVRYTEYGYLEAATPGQAVPFPTIRDWYQWENASLAEYLAAHSGDEALLFDEKQQLRRCNEYSHTVTTLGTGRFSLFRDRIEFQYNGQCLTFPFDKIANVSCQEKQILSFSSDNAVYEVLCDFPRSALKYQQMFSLLREQNLQAKEKE